MGYEVFKNTRARTKQFISVTENCTFGLPRTFLNSQKITAKHKAIILFNRAEMKVALHFTLSDTPYGFSVRIPNEKQGATIVAKSFFEVNKIDTKIYSGRYDDFKKVPLSAILDEVKDGGNSYAYEIQLTNKRNSNPEHPNELSMTDMEDIMLSEAESHINLDDIPF